MNINKCELVCVRYLLFLSFSKLLDGLTVNSRSTGREIIVKISTYIYGVVVHVSTSFPSSEHSLSSRNVAQKKIQNRFFHS